MAVLSLLIAPAAAQTQTAPSPAPAPAQDPAANDPDASSPPGQVYRLPLDDARGDAAPRSRSSRPAPKPKSALRSENGFGSSARVPGVEESRDDAGGSEPRPKPEPKRGDGEDDDAGGELRAQRPPPAAALPAEPQRAQRPAAAEGEPSGVRVVLLLVLALVIGAAVGLATRAARRRSSG
jgi:hypothetical protein